MSDAYKDLFSFIKKTEESQTIESQFLNDLDRTIQFSNHSHVPSKSIKPSALGGCYRHQWFMLTGAEADPSNIERAENITIAESGRDRHSRLQAYIMSAQSLGIPIEWLDPEEEIRKIQTIGINTSVKRRDGNEVLCWNEDYQVSFKCDGIIRYRGIKMILEIKTEDHFKWIQRFSPAPAHKLQAVLYSICLGIDTVLFLYENRNYTTRKAYKVTITDAYKDQAIQRINHLLAYQRANIVPPEEKGKCIYCRYKRICKATGSSKAYTLEELQKIIDEEGKRKLEKFQR